VKALREEIEKILATENTWLKSRQARAIVEVIEDRLEAFNARLEATEKRLERLEHRGE
jgi:hypothetical protein